jgi:PKD repeat protein
MSRTNWHMRAIHLVVALAFLLGLAMMPGLVTAQEEPSLVPSIDFDVKGAIHKVCIDWDDRYLALIGEAYEVDWWLLPGAVLSIDDVAVIEPSGPNPYCGGEPYSQTIKSKGFIDNVPCIELQANKVGDIHIYVDIVDTETGESILDQPLHAEKKWGELDHTILDVNADTSAVDHTESVDFDGDETGVYHETLQDTVYAWHPEWGVRVVDDAIVHWWLVEDDEENQEWVNDLMDYLAAHDGGLDDDHWAAHGKYDTTDMGDRQPWEYINDWVIGVEDPDLDGEEYFPTNLFWWDSVDLPGDVNNATDTDDWYAWAVTDDGIATATLAVNLDDETGLEACHTYNVMVVVLVSYPGGSTPQEDPFNGEQIVCLEKGKKSFHKGVTPEIEQVKTPQLRWAGEKIVLEKEWPYEPYYEQWDVDMGSFTLHYIDVAFYAAVYSLEEGSIGNLEAISDASALMLATPGYSDIAIDLNYLGLPAGAQQVICPLGGYYIDFEDYYEYGGYADTQAILVSEQSGQADVNVALYEVRALIEIVEGEVQGIAIELRGNGPIMNHGFVVYFLEFEDVRLANTDEGVPIDITTWESLTGLTPEEDDGYVAVQVRGFFDYRHSHLPATLRPEQPIDYNGDGTMDVMLPEGRYILPDDWWLLAGTDDISLRPNFDLMDQAHLDTIVSPVDTNLDYWESLGPYDSEVRTTDPPGEAEWPTIGPFSTYQLWSTSDMWIAEASVPSSLPDDYQRNTVVPDGVIDWFDAPMPQALVIFDVDPEQSHADAALSELIKGDLEGYGFEWSGDDKIYQSPYYAVEIPANWQIPVGYNWRSWERDPSWMWWYLVDQGPYPFWNDLELESVISNTHEDPADLDDQDIEVYTDNHGIAAVTVDALDEMGMVTITATAEYPYLLRGKYGPRVSEDIPVIWGPPIVHLDADFEAEPRDGDAPLTVTFDPAVWTIGGTTPYVKLVWDFGDGSPTVEVTGSWARSVDLPTIDHTYTTDGVYTVSVEITDSTVSPIGPMVDICEKIAYITVGAGVPTIRWDLPYGLDVDPAAVNIWTYAGVPVTLADLDATMPDGLLIWYYGGPTVGWKFYKKGWGASNTLTTLVPGGVFGIVPTASVWDIPQD